MPKRHPAVKTRRHLVEPPVAAPLDTDAIRTEIEQLAHQHWIDRGCPIGTPDEDWIRAEREIRAKYSSSVEGEALTATP